MMFLAISNIPTVSADVDIFDILDEQFITDISELPYSPGTPEMNWQQQGNIRGWVEVVGWKNLSRKGTEYFISGNPDKLAIIAGDATGSPPSGYGNGAMISLTKSISSHVDNGYLIATIDAKLTWFLTCTDRWGTFNCGQRSQIATFQNMVKIPEQAGNLSNPAILITEYNNSLNPRTSIEAANMQNISMIIYTYNNESMTNYRQSAQVERTENGIYYANITDTNIWTASTPHLTQMANKVIIKNSTDPDYVNLTIHVSNLYESRTITTAHRERETYLFVNSFSKLLLGIMAIFTVLGSLVIYTARRTF